ncbi:hypothetical protein [Flavobacterium sp.]|uniref:hypothetical protein n=1 Tax=Flavobacterium sp. TaxID=239 RepID=UPI004034A0D9
MKVFVNIVLFLFVSFLATPTIVSMVEDDADVSMVYSLTEEEIQKEIKEVKAAPHTEFGVAFIPQIRTSSLIKSANLERHDNIAGEICSPPPELI